jgi:predicted AlkP superfamily pyrophosphatase or phosphodiesterase
MRFVTFLLLLLLPAAAASSLALRHGAATSALLIGMDGLGAHYLRNVTEGIAPNLVRLAHDGTVTYRARNVYPSGSAPNWAAILTSLAPADSGIRKNGWKPLDNTLPPVGPGPAPPTIWQEIKSQRPVMRTAMTTTWGWLRELGRDGVDYFRLEENDEVATDAMIEMIAAQRPNLMFVHLNAVDDAGHAHQWGTDKYYDAVRRLDANVGRLLSAVDSRTFVLAVADHGGLGHGHSAGFDAATVEVPMIFRGPGAPTKGSVEAASVLDCAPTLMRALGLQVGKYMRGKSWIN